MQSPTTPATQDPAADPVPNSPPVPVPVTIPAPQLQRLLSPVSKAVAVKGERELQRRLVVGPVKKGTRVRFDRCLGFVESMDGLL